MNIENRMLMEGDNLEMMRSIDSRTVDLIATDPPFYGKEADLSQNPARSGRGEHWHDDVDWSKEVDEAEYEVSRMPDQRLQQVVELAGLAGGREFACFMAYMSIRIREMHRLLKDDGIISWHCDYAASAYLKMVFDVVFGYENLLNELVWKRTGAKSATRRLANVHDTLLIYRKGDCWTWNPIFEERSDSNIASYDKEDHLGRWKVEDLTAPGPRSGESGVPWRGFDPSSVGDGRHWTTPTKGAMKNFIIEHGLISGWPDAFKSTHERLDSLDEAGLVHWSRSGRPYLKRYLTNKQQQLVDVMIDVPRVASRSPENRGYRDQKPPELYRRIISATTNETDWVLDPFCGCGTTLGAAEGLNRKWIGIDKWEGAYGTCREWFDSGTKIVHVTEPLARLDDGKISSELMLTEPKRVELQDQPRAYVKSVVIPVEPENQQCKGCDELFNRTELELAHVFPKSKGGKMNVKNIVALCRPCNQLQGDDLTLAGLRRLLAKNKRIEKQKRKPPEPTPLV